MKAKTYKSKIVRKILNEIPKEEALYIERQMIIASLIDDYMKNSNTNIKELAAILNIKTSKIKKYLSGTHNFTLKEICDLEVILDINLITVNE